MENDGKLATWQLEMLRNKEEKKERWNERTEKSKYGRKKEREEERRQRKRRIGEKKREG